MDSGGSSEGSDHNTSVIDLTGGNSEDRRSIDRTQDDINISSFDMEGTTVVTSMEQQLLQREPDFVRYPHTRPEQEKDRARR